MVRRATSGVSVRGLLFAGCALVTAACGGGGGGGPAPGSELFPTVATETVPPGSKVDLRDIDFNPVGAGDRWVYDVLNTVGYIDRPQRQLVVEVIAGPDANGFFTTRTDSPQGSTQQRYQLTGDGLLIVDAADDLLPAKAASIVGSFRVFPTLVAPQGLERIVFRRGSLGQDLDGDSIDDGFEFEYGETFHGVHGFAFSAGDTRTVSFTTRTRIAALPSRAGFQGTNVTVEQNTRFVEGLGIFDVRIGVSGDPLASMPPPRWTLSSARVSGKLVPSHPGVVRLMDPAHTDQLYDAARNRYLVSQPASANAQAAIWAIDPATATLSRVASFETDPLAMAISADGASLYVGFANNDVARFALTDFSETGRVNVAGCAAPLRLVSSPIDPGTVLVVLRRPGDPTCGALLVRDMVVLPAQYDFPRGPHFVFSADGQAVIEWRPDNFNSLARFRVEANGLQYESETFLDAAPSDGRTLAVAGPRLLLGQSVYDAGSLAFLGNLPGALGGCVPVASNQQAICRIDPAVSRITSDLGVYDLVSRSLERRIDHRLLYSGSFLADGHVPTDGYPISKGPAGSVMTGTPGFWSDGYAAAVRVSELEIISSPQLP